MANRNGRPVFSGFEVAEGLLPAAAVAEGSGVEHASKRPRGTGKKTRPGGKRPIDPIGMSPFPTPDSKQRRQPQHTEDDLAEWSDDDDRPQTAVQQPRNRPQSGGRGRQHTSVPSRSGPARSKSSGLWQGAASPALRAAAPGRRHLDPVDVLEFSSDDDGASGARGMDDAAPGDTPRAPTTDRHSNTTVDFLSRLQTPAPTQGSTVRRGSDRPGQVVDSANRKRKMIRGGLALQLQRVLDRQRSDLTFWEHHGTVSLPGAASGALVRPLVVQPASSRKAFGYHVAMCSVVALGSDGGLVGGASASDVLEPGDNLVVLFSALTMAASPVHSKRAIEIYPPWHAVTTLEGRICIVCTTFSKCASPKPGGVVTDVHASASKAIPKRTSPHHPHSQAQAPISPYKLLAPTVLFSSSQHDALPDVTSDSRLVSQSLPETDVSRIGTLHAFQPAITVAVVVDATISADDLGVLSSTAEYSHGALVHDAHDGVFAVLALSGHHEATGLLRRTPPTPDLLVIRGLRILRTLAMSDCPGLHDVVTACGGSVPQRIHLLVG